MDNNQQKERFINPVHLFDARSTIFATESELQRRVNNIAYATENAYKTKGDDDDAPDTSEGGGGSTEMD